jgi:hypothetical protein
MGRREDILRKVQALIDRANSTNFDGERDSCIAKADELMAKFAIEEFELSMSRPAKEREKPEVRDMVITFVDDRHLREGLKDLFGALAVHCGVLRGEALRYSRDQDGWTTKVVGYRTDLDWCQMLYVTVQMHLVSRMEPRPSEMLTDLENFTMLRESGMSWRRIFELMGWEWNSPNDSHEGLSGESARRLRTMRKQYTDLCKQEGRQPVKGKKADTYRASFADGYVARIKRRLREMDDTRESAATGKEVVLATREGDLFEFFYGLYPDLRPHPSDCDCETCHFNSCYVENCQRKLCAQYWAARRKISRYRAPRDEKVDRAAYAIGGSAAEDADLSGGRNRVNTGRGGELE